ncbi:hypothetical protein FA13DRAFT_1240946 [Coprinellus micaceus]|uniref:Uncharacterized protein n=1 Tax=Coprinellus micaceus TaxID=71717 RepID=A0A4Y7TPZ0_COPMI|nr:hypothetical protein FA13DRAFT_1240946 [Coprinellus micaceus]
MGVAKKSVVYDIPSSSSFPMLSHFETAQSQDRLLGRLHLSTLPIMQGTRDSNGCESAVEQTALPYQLFLSVVLTVVTFYCSSQEKCGEWFQTFTHCKQQCPTASYAVSVRASLPFSCYPVPPPDVWMTRLRHPPPVSRTYTLKYVGLWRFMLLLHRRMPIGACSNPPVFRPGIIQCYQL